MKRPGMSITKLGAVTAVLLAWCDCSRAGIFGYSYREVRVTVRDAETNAPISGADVYVSYPPAFLVFGGPRQSTGHTHQDGTATVEVAQGHDPFWCAGAEGYVFLFLGKPGKDGTLRMKRDRPGDGAVKAAKPAERQTR
jgi:hypothetical protein